MVRKTREDQVDIHPASRLLHEVLVLNDSLERSMCSRLNINETDFQALQHLMRHQSMTPGGLAAQLHISSAATTAVIDRLGDRGHVLRAPHPTDRRSSLISPSPRAIAETMAALRPLFSGAESVITALGHDEQKTIVLYLEAMLRVMREHIHTMDNPTTKDRSGRS